MPAAERFAQSNHRGDRYGDGNPRGHGDRKRGSELADDFFYTTDREIVAVSYGQEVRCNKVDVAEMRENKEFLAFYTKDQRMVVIHKAACNTPETLARFKNRM